MMIIQGRSLNCIHPIVLYFRQPCTLPAVVHCLCIRSFSRPGKSNDEPIFTVQSAFKYLKIPSTSTAEQCREAYLKLARKLHPDVNKTSSDSASAAFQRLQEAYRIASTAISGEVSTTHSNQLYEDTEPERRHLAPQHRRYLETNAQQSVIHVEVAGSNPSERQKQLQTQRFVNAAVESSDYLVKRIQEGYESDESNVSIALTKPRHKKKDLPDAPAKSIRFFERIADDLIEESMRRGEFDNLPGQGQPIPRNHLYENAFTDSANAKLNKVMADQGYLPDWVQRGKELREQWDDAIKLLRFAHIRFIERGDRDSWMTSIKEFEDRVKAINRSIDIYNLQVPSLHLQRCHFDYATAVSRVAAEVPDKDALKPESRRQDPVNGPRATGHSIQNSDRINILDGLNQAFDLVRKR